MPLLHSANGQYIPQENWYNIGANGIPWEHKGIHPLSHLLWTLSLQSCNKKQNNIHAISWADELPSLPIILDKTSKKFPIPHKFPDVFNIYMYSVLTR